MPIVDDVGALRERECGGEILLNENDRSARVGQVTAGFDKIVYDDRCEALKRLVEQGLGVALVPSLAARSEVARGQLAALTVREMRLERKLYLLSRTGASLSHAARAFLHLAKEDARR